MGLLAITSSKKNSFWKYNDAKDVAGWCRKSGRPWRNPSFGSSCQTTATTKIHRSCSRHHPSAATATMESDWFVTNPWSSLVPANFRSNEQQVDYWLLPVGLWTTHTRCLSKNTRAALLLIATSPAPDPLHRSTTMSLSPTVLLVLWWLLFDQSLNCVRNRIGDGPKHNHHKTTTR